MHIQGILHYFFCSGLFSTIMRDLASINNDSPKWIVLDGDIDPMWIESLNTVMDDNKVTKCVRYPARVLFHFDHNHPLQNDDAL